MTYPRCCSIGACGRQRKLLPQSREILSFCLVSISAGCWRKRMLPEHPDCYYLGERKKWTSAIRPCFSEVLLLHTGMLTTIKRQIWWRLFSNTSHTIRHVPRAVSFNICTVFVWKSGNAWHIVSSVCIMYWQHTSDSPACISSCVSLFPVNLFHYN